MVLFLLISFRSQLILADSCQQYATEYTGCKCFNPGAFSADSNFIVYNPADKEVEFSRVTAAPAGADEQGDAEEEDQEEEDDEAQPDQQAADTEEKADADGDEEDADALKLPERRRRPAEEVDDVRRQSAEVAELAEEEEEEEAEEKKAEPDEENADPMAADD